MGLAVGIVVGCTAVAAGAVGAANGGTAVGAEGRTGEAAADTVGDAPEATVGATGIAVGAVIGAVCTTGAVVDLADAGEGSAGAYAVEAQPVRTNISESSIADLNPPPFGL